MIVETGVARRSRPPAALARPRATRRGERVLEAIATLGHPTGLERDLGDYLERVAAVACDALDYLACTVYLYDHSDDAYYAEATAGVSPAERQELLATPVPARVLERLMVEEHRLDCSFYVPVSAPVWRDPEVCACFTMSATPAPLWPSGWRPGDLFFVPLGIDGREPTGFLIVDEPVDHRLPDPETLLALAALAMSCANAVESAHLYKTRSEEAAISSALLQVSEAAGTPDQDLLFGRASAILATLLGADHCAVWHVEDGEVALRLVVDALHWGDDHAATAWARGVWNEERGLRAILARGEPVVVEGLGRDGAAGGLVAPVGQAGGPEDSAEALVAHLGLSAALLIPLFLHDTLAGAIVVGWIGASRRFQARELDIARGVSRLVGVALQNARLYRDTTRQAARNARLYEREREAVQRLQELDQLRNDFVSTVSHELRTPLTGIKGFADTLLTYWGRMDDARRVEVVRKINTSTQRLERLVHDLLYISRIESGVLPLRQSAVALRPLIDAAVAEIESKYRGQVIEVRPPAAPVAVFADPDRVQQVVVNLLDNAAKYSTEGRPIRIRWSRQGALARISVADRGPGIERDDFARLFTRFGKLGYAPRAGHVGTGLGLYISKSLVEAMGGAITVRSRLGWGSVFSFTLTLPKE